MAVNPDFRDLLSALNASDAEFLIVGAHAVMLYTEPRYTKDLDVWVKPDATNARKTRQALAAFGAPLHDLTEQDLATEGTIFQIGLPPNRIDIITSVDGLAFDGCYERALRSTYGDEAIRILSREDLLTNKRAVGRAQDLLDVERLLRAK